MRIKRCKKVVALSAVQHRGAAMVWRGEYLT
jgi:hypothetical protein